MISHFTLRRRNLLLLVFFVCSSSIHAHLMVSGHGTINWLGKSAYVVLSLPINAFTLNQKQATISQLQLLPQQQTAIIKQFKQQISLSSGKNLAIWDEVILNFSAITSTTNQQTPTKNHGHSHDASIKPEIIVMAVAKFAEIPKTPINPLTVQINLLAKLPKNQLKIRSTISENNKTLASEIAVFSAKNNQYNFFTNK